jgi:probable HAF family extracellular repeat protein
VKTLVLALLLCLMLVPCVSAQRYTVVDLGLASPTAINEWGQIVGNYNGHAYIRNGLQGWHDLGLMPGGTFAQANAISDDGIVAGEADGPGTVTVQTTNPIYPTSVACSDLAQPFVWSDQSGIVGLGYVVNNDEEDYWFPYNCSSSHAYSASGINLFGNVVGSNQWEGTWKYGFSWTYPAGMTLLATGYNTTANAINNLGKIAGQTGEFDANSHAALWNTQGQQTDLGTLSGPDPNNQACSGANSISDSGYVVGWSVPNPCFKISEGSSGAAHAFLWAQSAGMYDLGTLAGDTDSKATKVNFFGDVIGISGKSISWNASGYGNGILGVTGRPFVWSPSTGMLDLNSLIAPNSQWVLENAVDINMWGQIVGTGTFNGVAHGFLLVPKS